MGLGAGTLQQDMGNQSSTFLLNEQGPALFPHCCPILCAVAGEMLPALPLWAIPALLQMKAKPLGSLRWQKNEMLSVGSTPAGLERARDEVVLHWGMFYGMGCVLHLAIKASGRGNAKTISCICKSTCSCHLLLKYWRGFRAVSSESCRVLNFQSV